MVQLFFSYMLMTLIGDSLLHCHCLPQFSVYYRPLHYFLGIDVVRSCDSMVITQAKYTLVLLSWTNMSGCKTFSTLVTSGHKKSLSNGHSLMILLITKELLGPPVHHTYSAQDSLRNLIDLPIAVCSMGFLSPLYMTHSWRAYLALPFVFVSSHTDSSL